MTKVMFICHGNICRSTMAESVFTDMVKKRGLEDRFHIDSSAVTDEVLGMGVRHGTRKKLGEKAVPVVEHCAQQITKEDYDTFDYLICMDKSNLTLLDRIIGSDPQGKVYLLLQFAEEFGHLDAKDKHRVPDIVDPWYTHDFEATYRDIVRGCEGLLKRLV